MVLQWGMEPHYITEQNKSQQMAEGQRPPQDPGARGQARPGQGPGVNRYRPSLDELLLLCRGKLFSKFPSTGELKVSFVNYIYCAQDFRPNWLLYKCLY
jgi:hypothetical protein